jgi:hypothetical protein
VIGQIACAVKPWETATMSGPIVRKYGFPNFDKIFGERALEHGVDEEEKPVEQPEMESSSAPAKKAVPKKKSAGSKKS